MTGQLAYITFSTKCEECWIKERQDKRRKIGKGPSSGTFHSNPSHTERLQRGRANMLGGRCELQKFDKSPLSIALKEPGGKRRNWFEPDQSKTWRQNDSNKFKYCTFSLICCSYSYFLFLFCCLHFGWNLLSTAITTASSCCNLWPNRKARRSYVTAQQSPAPCHFVSQPHWRTRQNHKKSPISSCQHQHNHPTSLQIIYTSGQRCHQKDKTN